MPVRRLLLVLLLLLVGLLVAPAPASAGPRTDDEFVHRINASRTARGLPPLRVSARLTSLARSHAHAMAVNNCRAPRGCLWHTNISRSVDHWAWLGQNVGYGRFDGSWRNWVLRLHRAFLASPPHRANILYRRANRVGVGTVWYRGRLWVAVNFMQTAPG
jgi:uncharacterized protein YkwD